MSPWPALQSSPRDMLCSRRLGRWLLLGVAVCRCGVSSFIEGSGRNGCICWKKWEGGAGGRAESCEMVKSRAGISAEAWRCWEGQPGARDRMRDLAEEPCGHQRGDGLIGLKMSPREQPRATVTEPAEHRAVLALFCSYSVSF